MVEQTAEKGQSDRPEPSPDQFPLADEKSCTPVRFCCFIHICGYNLLFINMYDENYALLRATGAPANMYSFLSCNQLRMKFLMSYPITSVSLIKISSRVRGRISKKTISAFSKQDRISSLEARMVKVWSLPRTL